MAAFSTNAKADDGPHRFYDRLSDCSVYDIDAFPTEAANWDGPCRHGLAIGRGTATYFGSDGRTEMISADFREGMILDGAADIRWSDGARYTGEIVDGRPEGSGVLVNGKGDRFEGDWKDGKLNGHGSVAWTNGDRYEGDWIDGKAEGHGVQVWADGQKYDGAWSNDQPNGQGTVTRRDGSQYSAIFINGKRQVAAATPPKPAPTITASSAATGNTTPASNAAPAQQAGGRATPHAFLDGMASATLAAVDGSTLSLAPSEGGVVRKLTAADGTVQVSVFTFLGPNLGSVADESDPHQVTGLFRVTGTGVTVDYSDGRSELLRRDSSGGLLLTARSASGAAACSAWYPPGHAFSVAERRAAVAAYARRLGVTDSAGATGSGCMEPPAPVVTPASRPASRATPPTSRHAANVVPPPTAPLAKPHTASLQTIPVRDSNVHLIDTPVASTTAPSIAPPPPADERIASNCLKVDSDGSYWGFRNHCAYSVQFAYCLLHGVNPMTACDDKNASVSGSVSANGFGALFADESLAERDAEHQFRWVGCRGGAGEVIAQLDHAEPASGQCVRTKTAQRDN